MARKKRKELICSVVSETVEAVLKQKFTIRFGAEPEYFAQCNQEDCQYVDENRPPCPLSAEMFKEELEAIEARRAERKLNLN